MSENDQKDESQPKKIIAIPATAAGSDKIFGKEIRYRYFTEDGEECDKHGVIYTNEDLKREQERLELELKEEKADTQRKMAGVALGAIILFTALMFLPVIPDSRINALGEPIGLFYIAMAGIVGAFMGVTAWMSRK